MQRVVAVGWVLQDWDGDWPVELNSADGSVQITATAGGENVIIEHDALDYSGQVRTTAPCYVRTVPVAALIELLMALGYSVERKPAVKNG